MPSVTSVDAMRVQLAQQKDVGGNDVLDLSPALWLGPTKYGSAARVTNKAEYDPDAEGKLQRPNAVQGLFRDIVDTARIKDDKWYLFADPNDCPAIEVAFLTGSPNPSWTTRKASPSTVCAGRPASISALPPSTIAACSAAADPQLEH